MSEALGKCASDLSEALRKSDKLVKRENSEPSPSYEEAKKKAREAIKAGFKLEAELSYAHKHGEHLDGAPFSTQSARDLQRNGATALQYVLDTGRILKALIPGRKPTK